jgi:hypothetical protein
LSQTFNGGAAISLAREHVVYNEATVARVLRGPMTRVEGTVAETCESNCTLGILIVEQSHGIQGVFSCEECKLFETDEDAAVAVREILRIAAKLHHADNTVADAIDVLEKLVHERR